MMYEELIINLRNCAKLNSLSFYKRDLMAQAADAIEKLTVFNLMWQEAAKITLEEVPKWIPVTERLPEDNKAVNVVWVNHNPLDYYKHIKDKPQTATGVYYRGRWYWWSAVVQDYLAEYGEWGGRFDQCRYRSHPLDAPSAAAGGGRRWNNLNRARSAERMAMTSDT